MAGSDISAGFNDVLSNLQTLRQGIDGDSDVTNTAAGNSGNEMGVAISSGDVGIEKSGIRHRMGQ